jgi:hypothetical protein
MEDFMEAFLYPLITVLCVWLLVWSFRFFRESQFWGTSWTLFIILSLVYDNLILSLGKVIGTGDLLEMLSLVRYLLHVLLTPTLVFVSLDILRRIHVEWSEYMSTHILFHAYTFALTVLGVFTEILWINLEPVESGGVVFYVSTDHHFSFVTMLIIFPLLLAGVMVWRRLRWPVLLLGVLQFAIGVFASAWLDRLILKALCECVLMWCLVMTEQRLKTEDFQTRRTLAR